MDWVISMEEPLPLAHARHFLDRRNMEARFQQKPEDDQKKKCSRSFQRETSSAGC